MMIERDKFINFAMGLEGSYFDYGRCLYSMAVQNNILDEVYSYMTNQAKDVNDLDRHVYDLLGRPKPYIVVKEVKEPIAIAV